jgi:hypothetical protein
MDKQAIITKIQINSDEDHELYKELDLINKRKRAYTVKKMLAEYLKVKQLIQHLPRKPVTDVVIPPRNQYLQAEDKASHPLRFAGKKHHSIY